MALSDEKVFDAIDVYNKELTAWQVIPLKTSEWNDRGYIKYRTYYVEDSRRFVGIDHIGSYASIERLVLPADQAMIYPKFRAMQAVLIWMESQ